MLTDGPMLKPRSQIEDVLCLGITTTSECNHNLVSGSMSMGMNWSDADLGNLSALAPTKSRSHHLGGQIVSALGSSGSSESHHYVK